MFQEKRKLGLVLRIGPMLRLVPLGVGKGGGGRSLEGNGEGTKLMLLMDVMLGEMGTAAELWRLSPQSGVAGTDS